MKRYNISDLAEAMHATVVAQGADGYVDHLLLDSRKIIFPSTSLFFALKGPRRNGHAYIREIYERGVRNFVIDENIDVASIPGANIFKVTDTLQALQSLAAFHRGTFEIPVIGITGSNGKTVVKEWLNQLLEEKWRIIRSPKSYNSQTGVPLSVWGIDTPHELGIFEAGISKSGEMARLEPIIKPLIGIFTSIGEAHSEGFRDVQEKISEKLKLFIHANTLIYCSDTSALQSEIGKFQHELKEQGGGLVLFGWGRQAHARLQVKSMDISEMSTTIEARYENKNISVTIPFSDEASIANAMSCWCTMLCLGCGDDFISKGMKKLQPLAMRLELKQAINNCSLINDSYSADLSSLNIALDFLLQQRQHPRRTVILSDILQSGRSPRELYVAIAASLLERKVNRFFGIGPAMILHRALFEEQGMECFFYPGTAEFLHDFHSHWFHDETILIKGARVFEFEQINALLEQQVHQTVLEIDLSALAHNLKTFQQRLHPQTRIMAMVKAFSYGSGSYEIANLLQFHKVDWLGVAYADEGVELRKAGIAIPMMVMNPEQSSFTAIVDHGLEPEIFSFELFNAFLLYLKQQGITEYPVHIKLDTGMHRLGFEQHDLPSLLEKLKAAPEMRVVSVFSHLVASEDPAEDEFTRAQGRLFREACDLLTNGLGYTFIRHMANTAAITRHPDLQFDMVRLGIGLYGIAQDEQVLLKEVSTLKTTVAQIKHVRAGDSVGYGRKAILKKDALIATVRLGYADGYPRKLGNGNGYVMMKNNKAPIVGNVCMDMTMVDITGMDGIREGDEVLIFGPGLSIAELARLAGTIPYELMTGISRRVRRVYFEES